MICNTIRDSAKKEDLLPPTLLGRVSEAAVLCTTLQTEMEERGNYLDNQYEARLKYESCVSLLSTWLDSVKYRTSDSGDGIDFLNVENELREIKVG